MSKHCYCIPDMGQTLRYQIQVIACNRITRTDTLVLGDLSLCIHHILDEKGVENPPLHKDIVSNYVLQIKNLH